MTACGWWKGWEKFSGGQGSREPQTGVAPRTRLVGLNQTRL